MALSGHSQVCVTRQLAVMTRTYKCKKVKGYTEEQLLTAIEAVKERKMTVTMAAKQYKIPVTTLYDHTKGKIHKIGAGAPTVLTYSEEKEIAATLQVLQEIGFPLTKELVSVIIYDYMKDQPCRPNPFRKNGMPGRDWWNSFLKRWNKELSVRKPQQLSTHRAVSATKSWMNGLSEWRSCILRQYCLNCLLKSSSREYGTVMKLGFVPQ